MIDHDAVDHYLRIMGETAEQVCATLLAAGYKGEPRNPVACPVYHALTARFPGVEFSVCKDEIVCSDTEQDYVTAPPDPVQWFVTLFDGNMFPQLETRNDSCGVATKPRDNDFPGGGCLTPA